MRPEPEQNNFNHRFLLFMSIISLYSSIKIYFSPLPENYNSNNSFFEENNTRVANISNDLTNTQTAGYITDGGKDIDSDPLKLARFYQAQYTLAPIILSKNPNHRFVVGNFFMSEHKDIIEQNGLIIVKDYGDGLYLLMNEKYI